MTLQKMINELEKLKKKIGPRAKVVVNLRALESGRSDYISHPEVTNVELQTLLWFIDDSCELKDGSERMRTVVSIGGVE